MVIKVHLNIDASTEKSLKDGVYRLLKTIRPSWEAANISFKIYTEGISNALIGAWCEDLHNQVLVRVYGENTDLFIDRNSEIEAFKLLYKHGQGSELYATFNNGICYAFAIGSPLTPSSVTEERIYRDVAKRMADFHRLPIEEKSPQLFPKFRSFLSLYSDELKMEHVERLSAVGIDKTYMESEMVELENLINSFNCPVSYCHNDLLLQNIIWNEDEQNVIFIDFEYASCNFQPFDIADHFAEFAGMGIEMDYALYPSYDFQSKWLRVYLSHYYKIKEEDVLDELIKKWYMWVKTFTLATHLFWCCWCVVQAHHSKIDFDFIGYCITRMQEYRRRKPEFIAK